ncbi:hypothetical protein V7128_01845 [Neobacillus vireti]|uniref:hypothetical protein n=1 Tax=Neobacillus vireti TaxID=220686 RepID=UPI0030000EAB
MSILLTILGFLSTVVFGVLSLVGMIKKNGKAKKRGIYTAVSFVLFIIGITTMSPSDETVSTSSDQPVVSQPKENTEETKTVETQKETPKVDEGKKFDAAVSQVVNGLKINIAEVKIEKDKVSVGMNIENSTQQKITFYPDQGSVVIGNMQLESNMFMGTGDLSGDINAAVKKDGVIVFTVPEGKELDIASIKELKLNFGTVYDDGYKSEEANIVVPVK